jgi:hypothetical protein
MFLLSGLQNLLANAISLTNIYQSIDQNIARVNNTGVQYDLARLTRVLIIFPPIEPVDDDYTYVPSDYDPDLNRLIAAEAGFDFQSTLEMALVSAIK